MIGSTTLGLWLAVLGSGVYHGLNPGMGWPLAVSAGLMGKGRRDIVAALASLAGGHCAAMAAILLPFAILTVLLAWQHEIRVGAGFIVAAAGAYLLVARRHNRFLARIRPSHLALWSFAAAMAHGAGLILLPVYLELCRTDGLEGYQGAATSLVSGNLVMAVNVAALHAAAMVLTGSAMAFAVYAWLGLSFIGKSWFNLERFWAWSLIVVGCSSLLALTVAH